MIIQLGSSNKSTKKLTVQSWERVGGSSCSCSVSCVKTRSSQICVRSGRAGESAVTEAFSDRRRMYCWLPSSIVHAVSGCQHWEQQALDFRKQGVTLTTPSFQKWTPRTCPLECAFSIDYKMACIDTWDKWQNSGLLAALSEKLPVEWGWQMHVAWEGGGH